MSETRETSPEVEEQPIYGTLSLLSRKSGDVLYTCPMTAEHLTVGRDYNCDIRIYAPDVSKVHASIDFDGDTRVAALSVLGHNGVIHTSSHGASKSYKPPAVVFLADGDTFMVRKKMFKFTYGAGEIGPGLEYLSPAPKVAKTPRKSMPATPGATGATPRRKNTLRFSIVPEGKRFIPTPAKPRGLGLHGATTAKASASESKEYEKLLEVADGEGGEKIYVEQQDDSDEEDEEAQVAAVQIEENPFMAPNTNPDTSPVRSPVRRCRTPPPPPLPELESEDSDEEDEDEAEAEAEPVLPMSPHSAPVPLPDPEAVIPEAAPANPNVRAPAPMVPARVAYSTPRGSDSLRKSLLLRSARKIWEAERLKSVDGSIEAGHIEVHRRRKSSIGVAGTPRKSLPLPPPDSSSSESDEDNNGYEEEDEEEEEDALSFSDKENAPALQWIYEDGQQDVSQLDDSDSDRESLDLDIPGQAILSFSPEPEQDLSDSDEGYEDEDDDEDEDDEEPIAHEITAPQTPVPRAVDEDYDEEPSDKSSDESFEHPVVVIDAEPQKTEAPNPTTVALPEGPAKPLSSRFYTPQPARTLGAPRRSLAVGGADPAGVLPVTPRRNLGKAVRPTRVEVEVEVDSESESEDDPETPPRPKAAAAPKTPRGGLTPAQREKLATPRRLPEPPASFREPVRDVPVFSFHATPHRALMSPPSAPAPSEAPATPMDDIKRRLSALRLKTPSKDGRRTTVAFVLPETPVRSAKRQVPNTVGPRRHVPVETIEEGETESLPPTPTGTPTGKPAAPLLGDTDKEEEGEQGEEEECEPEPEPKPEPVYTPRRRTRHSIATPTCREPTAPKTPAMDGLRQMFKEPKPEPKTPFMAGMRELFKEEMVQGTPSYIGMREMLHEPKTAPKTPHMTGMRELFKEEVDQPTPALTGIKEMMRQPRQPKTPKMDGMRELFAHKVEPKTPALDGVAEMFDEEEETDNAGALLEGKDDEEDKDDVEDTAEDETKPESEPQDEAKAEAEAEAEAPAPQDDKPTRGTRTRLPMRAPKAAPAPAPAPAPTRTTRRAVSGPSASAPTRRVVSGPEAVRRGRKPVEPNVEPRAKVEPKESEVKEIASEPVRRSRRKSGLPPNTVEDKDQDAAPAAPAPKTTRRTVSAASTAAATARRTRARTDDDEAASTSTSTRRSRRVLGDAEQEAEVEAEVEVEVAPVRRGRAAAAPARKTATATTTTAATTATTRKAAVAVGAKTDEPTSASSRRRGKENTADVEEPAAVVPAPAPRRRAAAATAKTGPVPAAVKSKKEKDTEPASVSTSTRSRSTRSTSGRK